MPVNPTFAQGVDLSKWNVRYDPYKKPMDFAIIKASEGTARDPKFVELLGQCAPVPVRGAYHYYRSQADAGTGNAALVAASWGVVSGGAWWNF